MPSTTEPKTMKAVVLKKAFEIVTEERPVPTVEDDTDVVVKVSMSALCGSGALLPSSVCFPMLQG